MENLRKTVLRKIKVAALRKNHLSKRDQKELQLRNSNCLSKVSRRSKKRDNREGQQKRMSTG